MKHLYFPNTKKLRDLAFRTLIATVTQVTLEFGSESRTVTVDRENTAFLTELDAYTASTAPNALAIRKGVLRLVLIEKIAIS